MFDFLVTPREIFNILVQYKYWVIFPIALIEGPIITVISGFLIRLGVLGGFITYSVLVIADVLGDTVYYFIGRYWRNSVKIKKLVKFLGYDEATELYLEDHFKKHKYRTFLIGKFTHGIGGMIEIASGIAGMKFFEYLFISFITTLPKSLFLVLMGYYAGIYYEKIDGYFQIFAFITIGIVIAFLIFKISKKLKTDFMKEGQK